MVSAGYVIYGSSTMFVFATSRSVNGFTLDPSIGEFYLSHPNIKCPDKGRIYSINQGNYHHYSPVCKNTWIISSKKIKSRKVLIRSAMWQVWLPTYTGTLSKEEYS